MIEVNYELLEGKCFVNYLNFLINRFYKILPIQETQTDTLQSYLESLFIELKGNHILIDKIKCDGNFLILLGTLQYFIQNNDIEHSTYRREVFKCTNIIKKLLDKYGGD
jgi:hypothetical protein